jgi:tRNA A37 threonylcarbamoyladenosine modification protein TsaB|tara:strand:- start:2035 stop:2412 length:378 start_codon:yes stop_codon:yes gene_type:complete
MNFLVIDGTQNKINFFSYFNNNSYNKSFQFSKNNNEKFSTLLFSFLNENNINLNELNNVFVNQGPGKFSGIRTSIAVAKALSITNKLNLYGFNSEELKGMNYMHIIDLYNEGRLTKNLINPVYSS